MYVWTIALLSLLVIVSSATLGKFPYALVFGVLVAGATEAAIDSFYLKHKLEIPISGLITGLIIGSIAPINAPLSLVFAASVIGVASKFFLQFKHVNIFNPASLGLVFALALFNSTDMWWSASNYNVYGMALSLTPLLILLAYQAKRLALGLSFVVCSFLAGLALQGAMSLSAAITILLGINYYFAFVMLIEPKTSPNGT